MFFTPERKDYKVEPLFSYGPAGWQKCPVCDGSGTLPITSQLKEDQEHCPACDGKRLINKLTGKPPSD